MTQYPVSLADTNDKVHMWADEANVEDQALEQIREIARLPEVHGVRIMPDVHLGKGATVGSVIAMQNALAPAAVGVDLGCLDADTEFLSPSGWVRIADWDRQAVLAYDPDTDGAHFTQPKQYINLPCDEFYYFKNSKGMDQMLSEEHRVLVYQGHKARGLTHSVMSPGELAEKGLSKGYYCTKAAFQSHMPDLGVTDEMIRVDVMVQADGRVREYGNGNRQVELHFRLERKVARAGDILTAAGIDHRLAEWADGSTCISFLAPEGHATKSLDRYWLASGRQLGIIADESLRWDGHAGYRSYYSSTDKESVDLIQYAFAASGTRAGVSSAGRQQEHHAEVFAVTPAKNEMVGYCAPVMVPSPDGRKYCFVVDTGFFVARRNGRIFTTGNCGVAAVKTNLTESDLVGLPALRAGIEHAIPVGFNSHDGRVGDNYLPANASQLMNTFGRLSADVGHRHDRALSQIGTLGGGNHFIEVCADDDGAVWLTLHSGSRNIGKEIAERHIAKAKGLKHNEAYGDMAVFYGDTEPMTNYLADLEWAQAYAAASRETMMNLLRAEVTYHFAKVGKEVDFGQEMNCLAGETRVLTKEGVREIRELSGSTHTLLTSGGEWVEAPIKGFGTQKLYEVVVGRYGREKIIRATAGHRWLLRPKVAHNRTEAVTTDLRAGDRLDYAFPSLRPGLTIDSKGVARGFIFGDGSANKSRSYANFCGDKDLHVLPHFEWHHMEPREYTYDRGHGEKSMLRMNGFPLNWKKEAPSLEEPDGVLYGWLAGYFAADGDVGKTGRATLSSSDFENIMAVKSICGHLGIGTHEIRAKKKGAGSYPGAREISYLIGIAREHLSDDFFIIPEHRERFVAGRKAAPRHGWTVREVRETRVHEEVFCAVVEGTHSFTLEDNILTGNCHHNYVAEELIDGETMLVTRKGAIRAGAGEMAMIPGSMGTGSFIVEGLGSAESYYSASHGAGRRMSRTKAKKAYTAEDLAFQTQGIECRKDAGVVDEIPAAYKSIESVIEAQADLVRPVARLRTLLCVKG